MNESVPPTPTFQPTPAAPAASPPPEAAASPAPPAPARPALARRTPTPPRPATGPARNRHAGPREVHHVVNITDVGHMTDDDNADGCGDDKMALAGQRLLEAKKSGKLPDGVDIDTPRGKRTVGVKVIRVGSISPQPLG